MKTIIKITIVLILTIMASFVKAQTLTIIQGGSAVVSAINSSSLSSPIYSCYPGGYTSANTSFTVSPLVTTIYTLYVTGTNSNNVIQTTSNLVTVLVMPNVPPAQPAFVCAGASSVLTAFNSLGLSNPSYSMNPGGMASPNPTFMITPASLTTYTLYVTGTNSNSAVVTTSNLVTVQVASYPVTSVTPLNQNINCGPGIVANATCVAITPSTNITHNWYSPASPIPLSSGGQVSTFQMGVYNGSSATYTCVVVDNLSGCGTSKTVQVVSTAGNYPSYLISSNLSSNTFTLGCGTKSVTDVNVVNAMTVPAGGAISYTILPPGYTGGIVYNTSLNASYTVNVSGTYTVIVKDNVNLCESRTLLSVLQNTLGPNIGVSSLNSTLSCNVQSVSLLGSSNTPNVTYLWNKNSVPPTVPNPNLIVFTTPSGASVPSATVIDNFTLTVKDQGNFCNSNTVVTIYQNTRPPNAIIASSNNQGPCVYTLNLTNNSTIGILPGTFFINSPVTAILWEGPVPQPTIANSSSYMAQAIGIYTMTVMDMNNGCTDTGTFNVTGNMIKPTAAFVHTITGAQAVFNDNSLGAYANTAYIWDFGDGYTSTSQNPIHSYNNGGSYLVKLKATNPGFFCSDSVIQSVNVSGVPCSANSNFSMVPTNTAQVWNVIPSYPWNVTAASWNWGDGSSSNTLFTSHQYANAGMYNICLSVTVSCVASSSTCTSYSVYRPSQSAQIIAINVISPELILSGQSQAEADGHLNWNISPNPNAGEFQLDLSNTIAEPTRIMISDLTGRFVFDQAIERGALTMSLHAATLPPGMYLVILESNGQKLTKRMIVEH